MRANAAQRSLVMIAASRVVMRLWRLRERHKVAQNGVCSTQARVGIFPIVEKDDLHIGPHPSGWAEISDEDDKPIRIGKSIITERHYRSLGPGLDLFHIGLPAERLDRHDLEEVLDLLGQRSEA